MNPEADDELVATRGRRPGGIVGWLLLRLVWLLLSLFGVTFVTFLVLDLSPVDRAELDVARRAEGSVAAGPGYANEAERRAAVQRLRVRYGLVDRATGEWLPLWQRYSRWLRNAATLRLAGPGEDQRAFWRRLSHALPVTVLLGGIALLLAFGVGLPLGAWLGRNVGTRRERWWSRLLLIGVGVPDYLLATLLLLAFSVVWVQWLPAGGLRSPDADAFAFGWQLLDFAWHLVLPVVVLATGPTVMVVRFVRDAVARAAGAPFMTTLVALGVSERELGRRLLRHGLTPVATLAGGLLPMLVGGSIVVETLFGLDGVGRLAFRATVEQDQAMVMAVVLLTSVVTLLALLVSDVLHRLVDPRVRLAD